MNIEDTTNDVVGWQARMAAAARNFALRLIEPSAQEQRELAATLLRLGFPLGDTNAAVAGSPDLEPGQFHSMRTALRRELDVCKRRARAARIDYDLNRHITVFRALRQLDGTSGETPSPARRTRPSIAARSSATASSVAASIRR